MSVLRFLPGIIVLEIASAALVYALITPGASQAMWAPVAVLGGVVTLLAAAWEGYARLIHNPLLVPTFSATELMVQVFDAANVPPPAVKLLVQRMVPTTCRLFVPPMAALVST